VSRCRAFPDLELQDLLHTFSHDGQGNPLVCLQIAHCAATSGMTAKLLLTSPSPATGVLAPSGTGGSEALSEPSQLVTNNSTATRPGQRRKIEGMFSLTASAELERFDDEQHP
jgi:hypothetical protein